MGSCYFLKAFCFKSSESAILRFVKHITVFKELKFHTPLSFSFSVVQFTARIHFSMHESIICRLNIEEKFSQEVQELSVGFKNLQVSCNLNGNNLIEEFKKLWRKHISDNALNST